MSDLVRRLRNQVAIVSKYIDAPETCALLREAAEALDALTTERDEAEARSDRWQARLAAAEAERDALLRELGR